MDCDDEGLSKRNLYCDIQSIKNIRSVPTKKKQKNRKVWNVLVSKLLCNMKDLCALLNHAQERKVC